MLEWSTTKMYLYKCCTTPRNAFLIFALSATLCVSACSIACWYSSRFSTSSRVISLEMLKKSLKRFIKEDILESDSSDSVKASSVALGVFFGIAPFWGFQTILTITLAVFFNLNKTLAFICSNVSIPPMIPVLIFSSLKIGTFFVGGTILPQGDLTAMEYIQNNLLQYLVGSFTLAISASLLLGLLTYGLLKLRKR